MVKIDFQNMRVYTDIRRAASQTVDTREQFADMIYRNASGIRAHALAMKIYGSSGETDYTPEEVELIRGVAEQLCLPGFIDGLNEQIDNNQNE